MATKWVPDRKVLSGGIAGVVTWLVLIGLGQFGIEVPADVQSAITGAVGLAIAYLVPPSKQDIVKRLNDRIVAMAEKDPNVPVSPHRTKVYE